MKSQKSIIFILIIIVFSIISGCGQKNVDTSATAAGSTATLEKTNSERFTKISLSSKALKKDMKVNIYLPKGYSEKNKYPVLYLIHGYTGNEDTWFPGFQVEKKADAMIDKKEIKPLIIVAPQIDNSYGINSSNSQLPISAFNSGMYEDYLYKELVPYIETTYSTISS